METILEAMLIALLCICIMAYSIIHISRQWKEISLKYDEMRYLHTAHANEMSDAFAEIKLEFKAVRKTIRLVNESLCTQADNDALKLTHVADKLNTMQQIVDELYEIQSAKDVGKYKKNYELMYVVFTYNPSYDSRQYCTNPESIKPYVQQGTYLDLRAAKYAIIDMEYKRDSMSNSYAAIMKRFYRCDEHRRPYIGVFEIINGQQIDTLERYKIRDKIIGEPKGRDSVGECVFIRYKLTPNGKQYDMGALDQESSNQQEITCRKCILFGIQRIGINDVSPRIQLPPISNDTIDAYLQDIYDTYKITLNSPILTDEGYTNIAFISTKLCERVFSGPTEILQQYASDLTNAIIKRASELDVEKGETHLSH